MVLKNRYNLFLRFILLFYQKNNDRKQFSYGAFFILSILRYNETMLRIPEQGILIAPASLHLPLYQTIQQAKGNTIGLEVYSLKQFIQQFFKGKKIDETTLLFKTMRKCQDCSSTNVFYPSRKSYDFVRDTLHFIQYAKTYGIDFHTLSENNQKEKDLKEILCLLEDLEIREKQIPKILKQTPNFDQVYILQYEYNEEESLWIDFLLKNGAHTLEEESHTKIEYWSIANARKQAVLIAQTIVDQYDADDVFICCDQAGQRQVLAQMLDAYQIPYTFLTEDTPSVLSYQLICCLKWIASKDTESFITMINALHPETKENVQSTLRQFPDLLQTRKSHLPDSYQENALLDEYGFEHLQKQIATTLQWLEEHESLLHWDIDDIKAILLYLQEQNACTIENLHEFQQIQDVLKQCLPFIETKEDLLFLCDFLTAKTNASIASNIQGVLIGQRNEITALRKVCFLTDAHARLFPGLSMHNGIYDETYLANLLVPSLASRLKKQREQLFTCLSLPETLYILVPEATYDGKENPESHELEKWIGKKPQFQDIKESSIYEKPHFVLDPSLTKSLFFKEGQFTGSISRLESFARCPLQHFLHYGLYLKEKRETLDIRMQGSIYHHILEVLMDTYQKEYTKANKETVTKLVQNEFLFIQQVYPQQRPFFERVVLETIDKILKILEQLDEFEQDWHMHTSHQEYKVQMQLEWEDTPVLLYGYIDRIDASQSSFVIFDYKSSDKDISMQEFDAGLALQLITYTIAYEKSSHCLPAGCYYISLKTSPQTALAYKVNYRKKIPEATALDLKEQVQEAAKQKKLAGLMFQDLSIYSDNDHFAKKKEQPEYNQIKEQWQTILFSLLDDIKSGMIQPDHTKGACDYCAYKTICRNAANEVVKNSRLEKEEDHAL